MSHNKGAFYMAQTQKELRNALRTYKARNGLTWAQVATLLDVAQDTAKKYSTGRDAIPEHIATRLALLIEDENKPLKTGAIIAKILARFL